MQASFLPGKTKKGFRTSEVMQTPVQYVLKQSASTECGWLNSKLSSMYLMWFFSRILEERKKDVTVSPSLAQGLPFWRYLLWFCLFFWPPSANLHNKGSVGTEKATGQTREWIHWSQWGRKHTQLQHLQQYQVSIIQKKHSTHRVFLVESWWICHWNAELWPRTSPWIPSWKTRQSSN